MIAGSVVNEEALIAVEVGGPLGGSAQIEAVIDTGYNGFLTLPGTLVSLLQLSFRGHRQGTLADGSVVLLDVYQGTVVWHGQRKDVLISEAAGAPLVGMSLLRGNRLTAEIIDGGSVTIEQLMHP
jgi:clan AA aspartic protease